MMTVRSALRRVGGRGGSTSLEGRVAAVEAKQARLRRDLRASKAEIQANQDAILELRGLGGRVSELADLVTELLVLAATRQDPEFKRLVDKYLEGV
jgi:hypothetical protein